MFVYLDNSSTTRQHSAVTAAMLQMMEEEFGNPSSLHRMGIAAEKAMKQARKSLSTSLGVGENSIYFTGGGTEGNNTAIFGAARARKRRGNKIITSRAEHPAVLEVCRRLERDGFQVTYLDVNEKGGVDPAVLEDALDENTILVSLMAVNNELGTVAPLQEFSGLIRQKSEALFHSDGIQAYGKVSFLPLKADVDLAVVSGHKVHGPKGTGAIYVKTGLHIEPFLYGGGQERGFRSGTENVPGLVGLGVAADRILREGDAGKERLIKLRRRLLEGLRGEVADICVNSPEWASGENPDGGESAFEAVQKRGDKGKNELLCSPAILNVSFLGCRGEVLLHSLEQRDIYVSTGSACSSHKKGSHVLAAAGLAPAMMDSAIRFSLSMDNTEEQIDYTIEEVKKAVGSIRKVTRYK